MLYPNRLLICANVALIVLSGVFTLTLLLSYPLAHNFSLETQIAAHITTILVAALIKVSYVVRCVCQYQLGLEVR